jgi:hypothetical protein
MIRSAHLSLPNTQQDSLQGRDFIGEITHWSWVVLILSFLFQIVFHWSLMNLLAMASVIFGWIVTTKIFLKRPMLEKYPLSIFLIIGFTTTQLYFPMLFTTLEGKSLLFNLEVPEHVFLHSTLALIVLLLSHSFYRLFSRISHRRSFSVMEKVGFFTAPTERQLWMMGFIGIAAAYYYYFTTETGREVTEVTGSAGDKFVQSLLPFQYAPFFILMGRLFGGKDVNLKRVVPLLIGYGSILFLISIGRNNTSAFMFGFTAVAFGYFLGLLLKIYHTRLFTLKNVVIVCFFLWLVVGPVADLRTAMVNVREHRSNVSASEMMNLTIDAYFDKEAIETRRKLDEEMDLEWDERYLDNVLTARFGNIKFNDINLVQSLKIREYDPDMLDFSIDYMLGGLPDPFLKALNIDVDKESVYSVSIGDFIYLAAGGYGTVSGFRSGQFAGTGMATFSWWYLFILGIGMVFVFYLYDKFYRYEEIPSSSPDQPVEKRMIFSCCGLLALTSIFLYFVALQSVVQIAPFLYRGWIQLSLLYLLLYHFTRIFSGSFMRNSEVAKTLRRIKI